MNASTRVEARVDRRVVQERRTERPQRVASPIGDEQAHGTARQRQHHALDQQLPDDAAAARAERRADADLLFPRAACASSRFARFTHAISSTSPTTAIMHAARRARTAAVVDAERRVRHGRESPRCGPVGLRDTAARARRRHLHLGLRPRPARRPASAGPTMLTHRKRRLSTSAAICPTSSLVARAEGTHTRSGPASEGVPLNPGGATPMIVNGNPFENDRLAGDVGIGIEPARPDAVAQHRHRGGGLDVLVRREEAAPERP